ncbi:hypothetical protein [Neobacillus mesonae]|nr:hypothetical protein [Neobacillus mesonae]
MNVCNECGEASMWLDPDCGWCRDVSELVGNGTTICQAVINGVMKI